MEISVTNYTKYDASLVSGMSILKDIIIWRCQFQPSIFPIAVSLFHKSTWSDLYDKDAVFIARTYCSNPL